MATICARRRPIRDGVEPSNERRDRMSQVLPRQRKRLRQKGARSENDSAGQPCRGRGEKSNAPVACPRADSEFIAGMEPAAAEFFYVVSGVIVSAVMLSGA